MTLTKKLILGVLVLLLIVFIGNYAITLKNSRQFYQEQLNHNAQDTATSLGLSISQLMANNDKAMMLAMVQAVFDQGYFSSIEIYNQKNELIVSRALNGKSIKVPTWFRNLISWPKTSQKNVIMNGWRQMGYLLVTTDPEVAYLSIWKNAEYLLIWYAFFAIISCIMLSIAIRIIMKPLDRVTQQAQDICQRRFAIQATIPKTPELKKLTLAMNRMVHHLKNLFRSNMSEIQRLRQQAHVDQLTQLGNRRFFLQQANYLLTSKEEYCPGFFILVSLEGLDELNVHGGYQKGDQFILALSKYMQKFWSVYSQTLICRIGGSQFGLIIKEMSKDLVVSSMGDFAEGLHKLLQQDEHLKIYFTALPYVFNQSTSNLLTEADTNLSKARNSQKGYHIIVGEELDNERINAQDLKQALIQNQLVIYQQAVTSDKKQLHQELYLRLILDDKEISAHTYLPILQRLGLAPLVDNLMIDNIDALMRLTDDHYAVNISLNTIIEPVSRDALLTKLENIPKAMRHRLALEIPEVWLVRNKLVFMDLINQVIDMGFCFGIDQAGNNLSIMNYLQEIPLNYVKIHGSLIHNASKSEQSEMMLRYLVDLLQTVGIEAIATQVQSEDEMIQMQKMGITWLQGYVISAANKMTN